MKWLAEPWEPLARAGGLATGSPMVGASDDQAAGSIGVGDSGTSGIFGLEPLLLLLHDLAACLTCTSCSTAWLPALQRKFPQPQVRQLALQCRQRLRLPPAPCLAARFQQVQEARSAGPYIRL